MPRETKLTPAVTKAIAADILKGLPFKFAAAKCGVSDTTAYRWMQEGEGPDAPTAKRSFRDAVHEARAQALQNLVDSITAAAEGRYENRFGERQHDWRAAAWLAERMAPTELGQRAAIEHSGPHGGPIQIEPANLKERIAEYAESAQRMIEAEAAADDDGADTPD